MLLSVPLVIEYQAVMSRAEHLAASRLTASDVGELLDAVVLVGEPIRPAFLWRPTLRDANDDMVLEVAANGQADLLVTFNVRDFAHARAQFGIGLCRPSEAIARLENKA